MTPKEGMPKNWRAAYCLLLRDPRKGEECAPEIRRDEVDEASAEGGTGAR